MIHMILSALCTACSTRLSPQSHVKQYHVDPAVDHLVVGIEADEGAIDLDARPELRAGLQPVARPLDDGLVDIGDRRQCRVGVRAERLCCGSAAPAAAAHKADLDGI